MTEQPESGIALGISPEKQKIYEALLAEKEKRLIERDREELPKSLSKFIAAGWHVLNPEVPYHHNWHIDAICAHLEAVSRGDILRLQIWVPPGSMKTGTVSIFWHPWEWTMRPWLRYWSASYETRLAGRMSAQSRTLMMDEWYTDRWGERFEFIREGEHYYGNNRGGTRLATAPKSTGTGEHGHRIIVDDPIKADAADATSRVTLDEANNWWDGTLSTRGISIGFKHARVIVMQRLHEDDLAGHVLDIEDWTVLCLPEKFESDHPHVWRDENIHPSVKAALAGTQLANGDPRQEGELLWPAHRDEQESEVLAKSLTTHRAAGQLQQRPAAREGEILKTEWWRYYDPRIREREEWKKLGHFDQVVISVDTPLKDKESSDNVAIQVWGVKGADRYLLDLWCEKMNYGKAKRTIRDAALWASKVWRASYQSVLIENAGYGVELIVDLKRDVIGVQKIVPGPDGNKETRAESASDALESGNYFLPGYGPPWQPAYDEHRTPQDVANFIASCARFPHGKHDDDVDAWSQFGNWIRSRQTAPIRISPLQRLRRNAA
jgi:predicted phage terminase large subunit-like protein